MPPTTSPGPPDPGSRRSRAAYLVRRLPRAAASLAMLDGAIRSVAPQVIQAPVRGSSIFLLLDRRVTVVDAGPVGSAARILRTLRLLGRTADEVEQVIITHYHPDHVGGLAGLQRQIPART